MVGPGSAEIPDLVILRPDLPLTTSRFPVRLLSCSVQQGKSHRIPESCALQPPVPWHRSMPTLSALPGPPPLSKLRGCTHPLISMEKWSSFKNVRVDNEKNSSPEGYRYLYSHRISLFYCVLGQWKKGFINKIYAIQEVCISVQNILDEVASFGERIKKWGCWHAALAFWGTVSICFQRVKCHILSGRGHSDTWVIYCSVSSLFTLFLPVFVLWKVLSISSEI